MTILSIFRFFGVVVQCGPIVQADKRAHHNALERRRRDHIKYSFSSLRDAVPSLQGEKYSAGGRSVKRVDGSARAQASRAQILKKAADYIQTMRRKNTAHLQDIEDLKQQNKLLEEQIRSLEKTKMSGGSYSSGSVLDTMNMKGDSISAFDGGSGSESSEDTDNSSRSSRKKLKSSPGSTPLHS
ncbi:protein max-like isoform X3 [Ornithodoros turicata]|uniref:protein max-like isoform X3 n=1 Tax=Ornithodoros turicata TaxID=34597 RepID=UPI0031386C2D